jgi:DNA invertase Pin-like site-specific DNA recombinase
VAASCGAYTEVETGKRADRPELARALADCKRSKAVLVIAKLDRLTRNIHFRSGLMKATDAYADLAPAIASMRSEGLSLRQIAARLTTRRGKAWNHLQVAMIIELR